MAIDDVAFTHRDRRFRCHVDMGDGPGNPLARPSEAVWVVEVDGESYAPFDASPDDTQEGLVRRVVAWFESMHPS